MNKKQELISRVVDHLLETDSSLQRDVTYQVIDSLKYSRSKLIKILNFDDTTTLAYIECCKKYYDNEIDYIKIN